VHHQQSELHPTWKIPPPSSYSPRNKQTLKGTRHSSKNNKISKPPTHSNSPLTILPQERQPRAIVKTSARPLHPWAPETLLWHGRKILRGVGFNIRATSFISEYSSTLPKRICLIYHVFTGIQMMYRNVWLVYPSKHVPSLSYGYLLESLFNGTMLRCYIPWSVLTIKQWYVLPTFVWCLLPRLYMSWRQWGGHCLVTPARGLHHFVISSSKEKYIQLWNSKIDLGFGRMWCLKTPYFQPENWGFSG